MILKSLRLKNIRSYLDETIEFPQGTLLLSGDIGSGKSSVLMALDFALFGTRRGEIAGSELLRHGKNFGSVELLLDAGGKEITVKRTLQRKKGVAQDAGEIAVNGVAESCTATELSARLVELLGYPREKAAADIFRYTVYTPQEQMQHILNQPEERMAALRKIFDIEKYGRIRNNAQLFLGELRAMRREIEGYTADLDEKTREHERLEREYQGTSRECAELRRTLSSTEAQLHDKEAQLGAVTRSLEQAYALRRELVRHETEEHAKRSGLSRMQRELEILRRTIADVRNSLALYDHIRAPGTDMTSAAADLKGHERMKERLIAQRSVLVSDVRRLEDVLANGVCSFCSQEIADTSSFRSRILEKAQHADALAAQAAQVQESIALVASVMDDIRAHAASAEKKALLERQMSGHAATEERVSSDIERLSGEIAAVGTQVQQLTEALKAYETAAAERDRLSAELAGIESERSEHMKQLSRYEQRAEDLRDRILASGRELADKRRARSRLQRFAELSDWLDRYFIGLMGTIERHVLITLQKEFNAFFQNWFNLLVEEESLSAKIDENFSPVIEQNSFETSPQNLSGGEKTALALAYRLALNRTINALIETIRTKGLIILDEPTDGFSSAQLDRLRDVIRELGLEQVIIVSHEQKIDSFVDSVIRFRKENHVSRIER